MEKEATDIILVMTYLAVLQVHKWKQNMYTHSNIMCTHYTCLCNVLRQNIKECSWKIKEYLNMLEPLQSKFKQQINVNIL